jgi:hypothetical protein
VLGGGIGGAMAAWLSKKAYLSRSVIGVVTGIVLYWGVLFGLLVQELPKALVLNPFSGLVIPILGGWAGTAVFNTILNKFGISVPGPQNLSGGKKAAVKI